jgi:hypothetical protein
MRYLAALLVTLAAACSSADTSAPASVSRDLKCVGTVTVNYTDSKLPPVVADSQTLAVHVTATALTFTGNSYLGSETIKVCPERLAGEVYFDTDTCAGDSVTTQVRRYGTLNKVTGALMFSSRDELIRPVWLTFGEFSCAPVTPVVP